MVFRFTIDSVLNQYLWPNQCYRFGPFKRFFGVHSPKPVDDYWVWLEILVATFCGIALLEGVFKSHTVFSDHHVPIIFASYGATAILCFNASLSPLAQPRNVLVGHFIGSLVGVCIQKLFLLSEVGQQHYWASGALSVAVLSVAMSILNCVHPPAGASALLPSIDEQIQEMGWWYLPAQLVSCALMIPVACITGNIIRVYPVFWWTPEVVGKPQTEKPPPVLDLDLDREHGITYVEGLRTILISADEILVPASLQLGEVDLDWIEGMKLALRNLEPSLV